MKVWILSKSLFLSCLLSSDLFHLCWCFNLSETYVSWSLRERKMPKIFCLFVTTDEKSKIYLIKTSNLPTKLCNLIKEETTARSVGIETSKESKKLCYLWWRADTCTLLSSLFYNVLTCSFVRSTRRKQIITVWDSSWLKSYSIIST